MKPQIAKDPLGAAPGAAQRSTLAYDSRFRRLLSGEDWRSLPPAVRRRFSKRIEGEKTAIYPGVIVRARQSFAGRVLAQLCRVIGAPLPLGSAVGVLAKVSVSEDAQSGGQCWRREYAREGTHPQVIHSAKRFAGPTGLEEHIGGGFGMALRVEPIERGLAFRSDHYFVAAFGKRLRLPRWLSPGQTEVLHIDEAARIGRGHFTFSLCLTHKWLGELIYQEGVFRDG